MKTITIVVVLLGFSLIGSLIGQDTLGSKQKQPPAVPAQSTIKPAPPEVPSEPLAAALTPPTDAELRAAHVNESGMIPMLEYHEINSHKGPMSRSIARFRADLERLYKEGYRPITTAEYLDNAIDIPLGKSPVIFTFDDARTTQFRYRKDGTIEPNCALGILQAFAKKHPDFPVKAMFYVLPASAFGSSHKVAAQKMKALLDMGCELGNHTLNHHYFYHMTDSQIVREIAMGKAVTEKMTPGAKLDVLALPGGCLPRSKNGKILMAGKYGGTSYKNRAVIMAWGGPSPSPVSPKFNPQRIPRVLGVDTPGGIPTALNYLKRNPDKRYVSDGDPDTITVPKRLAKLVDKTKLQDATLRFYVDTAEPRAKTKAHKK